MIVYPNAKINIGLNITEKRNDGYHNIETVFYPIGLSDILEITPCECCSDYSFSISGIKIDGDSEDNLIVKAYRKLQQFYDIPAVDITLIKNIPFGAGLGGGSSDAAFALKTLNKLFDLKITDLKLQKIAAELGADCPVFIKNKPVYATGIGNVFQPLKISLKSKFLLLVKPDIFVSTPEAYSKVIPHKPDFCLLESIQKPISEWKRYIKNDFEESVFSAYPQISVIKNNLYEIGALYASMSGSGSAVYGIFEQIPAESDIFKNCFISGGYLK